MVSTTPKRTRTAIALLEAAAAVFAEKGNDAVLADVSDAARVGRATLYRYFPNREALVTELINYAVDETSTRLVQADLDNVDLAEALARVCRALIAARAKYAVLAGMTEFGENKKGERIAGLIFQPIEAIIHRGVEARELRADLDEHELFVIFGSIMQAASRLAPKVGIERAASIATSVFLGGAGRSKDLPGGHSIP
jgi:TetR/AcrR family transcriptional repressor of mexCD-oprJ operon